MSKSNDDKTSNASAGVDRTLARHGGLTYLEIPAIDVRQSAEFYKNVLAWSVQEGDDGATKFSDPDGYLIGRWVVGRKVSREPGWLQYFYVDEIDLAVLRAAACGGTIVKPPGPEGNLLVAIVSDPAGNVLGVWQAAG